MDFARFRAVALGGAVVAASNARAADAAPVKKRTVRRRRVVAEPDAQETSAGEFLDGAGDDIDCVEAMRRGRELTLRILALLEEEQSALEKAAVKLAWMRVLNQLSQAGSDEALKEAVANLQKLLGTREAADSKAAKAGTVRSRSIAKGLRKETRASIEEMMRSL